MIWFHAILRNKWFLPPLKRKKMTSSIWPVCSQVVKILFLKNNSSPDTHIHTCHSQSLLLCGSVASRVWLFATPWNAGYQAPLSRGFSGKNPGVGCHFLLQGIFPTQRSYSCLWGCCIAGGFFTTEPPGSPITFTHSANSLHSEYQWWNSLAYLSNGEEWSQVCIDS